MSNIKVDYDILNQKQTPAFYASSLATRPTFGFPGRIFIDTDTPSSGIYRDTGSAWVQVADPGAGTTGTLQQVTTNGNTTTNSIQVQGIDFSDGAGTGLYNIAIGNQTMGANTTGNNNIGIGYQTLKFNTTGALNVAVGNTALVNNTTGSQNTAVGQLALNFNTAGSQNTALGNATLQNNTTGNGNTAIGHASLVANTTANYNTAIGQDTLRSNTTGSQNVSIGYLSLSQNLVGNQNVAIGNNALQNSIASQNTAIGYSTLITNTTGANSTAVGNQALQQNTTGTQNTAIGSGALANNTTANYNTAIGVSSLGSNTTASFNTAIGHASLQLNTTGANNTALGFSSLNANTTGANNTAIGLSALSGNTTASFNTAIGSSSLLNNTTGNTNTAIGFSSLIANTTGAGNIAIGSSSLFTNTTGSNNVAIGTGSSYFNTTGSNNTAVGYDSLKSNTNGQYNVAVGAISLNVSTTGVNNTAVGYSALQLLTIGGGNVAIGYGSGSAITTGSNNYLLGGGQAITTGSYNTIIGSYGGSSALSNYIVLSDGQSNIRLFANDTGKVGINVPITDTPTGQVDIHTSLTNALVLNGNTTNNAYLGFASAGVNKWRIGNTYNAGANSFDIYNIGTSTTALSFNSTTNAGSFIGNVIATTGTTGAAIKLSGFTNYGTILDVNDVRRIWFENTGSFRTLFDLPATGTMFDFRTNAGTSLLNISSTGLGVNATPYGNSKLTLVASTNPTTASSNNIQLSIGEASINTVYSFKIGYLNTAGGYVGSIQSIAASNPAPTLINADGGSVLVGSTTDDTINKLQVTGYTKSSGFKSLQGTVSIASFASATIYTVPSAITGDGVYYVYCRLAGGAAIYMASAIVTALGSTNELFISNTRTGANVALIVTGSNIQITNLGFATFNWQYSIIFQPVD